MRAKFKTADPDIVKFFAERGIFFDEFFDFGGVRAVNCQIVLRFC